MFEFRALPVVGQVFERDAVVLGGIANAAADRADVFAGRFRIAEIDLAENGRDQMSRSITRFASGFSYPCGVCVPQYTVG